MKTILTIFILVSGFMANAQCQYIECTGKSNIHVNGEVSSNTTGNACYIGSGDLYEYSIGKWSERNFIGYINVVNKFEIPDSAVIQTQVITMFDTLVVNSYDTLKLSGLTVINTLINKGIGSVIIFENSTDCIIDSLNNRTYHDGTYQGIHTYLCRNNTTTGIFDINKDKKNKLCTRPGFYNMIGQKLNEKPRGITYIKDCQIMPAEF